MSIDMGTHPVRVAQHRDGTLSLHGLTINDLSVIQNLTEFAVIGMHDADTLAWVEAFATLVALVTPMTGSFDAALPWVDR